MFFGKGEEGDVPTYLLLALLAGMVFGFFYASCDEGSI